MTSRTRTASTDESAAAFEFRRGGNGIKASWKTLGLICSACIFAGGVWWTLQDHGKNIESLKITVAADHDILIRLDAYITNRPRRAGDGEK